MNKTITIARRSLLSPILAMALIGSAAAATISVDITLTDLGGSVFHHDLVVTNMGVEDIALLTINDAHPNDSLIAPSLTAPAEFFSSCDPLGFIDFGENTSTFADGNTYSGFDSAASTDFSALTTGGNSAVVTTTLIPKPSTSLLALGCLFADLAARPC